MSLTGETTTIPPPPGDRALKTTWQDYARARYAGEVDKAESLDLALTQLAEARAALAAIGNDVSEARAGVARLELAIARLSQPAPAPAPEPVISRYYIGHWMIGMGRWGAGNPRRGAEDYRAVIEESVREHGMDALAVYWDGFAREHIIGALEGAKAAGLPAIAFAFMGVSRDELLWLVRTYYDHPGVFKSRDGEIVITGYYNVVPLIASVVAELRAEGYKIAYWPEVSFRPQEPDQVLDPVSKAAEWHATGLFRFFHGGSYGLPEWTAKNDDLLKQCRAAGIEYMPHVMPLYAGAVNYTNPSASNWQVAWLGSLEGIVAQWRWIRENNIRGVQRVTINDYNERTYSQTFGSGAPIVGTKEEPFWGGNLVLAHDGFGRFEKRHADWWRTGVEPSITADEVFVAHTLHPKNAPSWDEMPPAIRDELAAKWLPWTIYDPSRGRPEWLQSFASRLDGFSSYEDTIQWAVRLTAPARIILRSGTETKDCGLLPAGEHILKLGDPSTPFAPSIFGRPSLELILGTSRQLFESELEITPNPIPGCWNIYARQLQPKSPAP